MHQRLLTGILALLVTASGAFSQMQLHSLYSRAVKEGYTLQTKVDSLLIDTRVNSGLAVSRYTMVVEPGSYNRILKVDTLVGEIDTQPQMFDSIEITLSFQLPSDFAADSMWLWVDGKPVPAYIQDRALASQQYQQIVGKRRDPALLETWGRGSYSLRIFPASSFKARKITIEFHHTFDDDTASGATPLMTACVPVLYDSLYSRYYSGGSSFDKSIGTVIATFAADDRTEYSVELPGLGSGSFSSGTSLTLSGTKVCRLGVGTIYAEDPSAADELLWVGRDPVSTTAIAGAAFTLSDATMRFDDEPDTRIIIIDMRNSVWDWNEYYKKRAEFLGSTYTAYSGYEKVNIMERAQKCAILALQQYLKPGQKFNVLLGGASVQSVFDAPVEVNDVNLETAIRGIVAAVPSPSASTLALLEKTAEQAPEGIAILISDLFQPFDYQERVDNVYKITASGNAYLALIDSIAAMTRASDLTLFTVEDNYQLYRAALESGGYRLSGILNRYNFAFHYEIVNGRRVSIPDLPPLFGSLNSSGIRNLSITADGLTDLAYTIDGYYNGVIYYSRNAMGGDIAEEVDRAVPKVLGKMVLPNTYNVNSVFVRIAGKIDVDKTDRPVAVAVRGKNGGLWFSCEMSARGFYPPAVSSYQPHADPQWAFRTTEQLSFDDYIGNAAAIEKLGREYHIVTRQTSLLALEPGMDLWIDSTWQQEQQNTVTTSGSAENAVLDDASADYASERGAPTSATAKGNGVDLDGISLDDILRKQGMAVAANPDAVHREFTVVAHGAMMRITLPLEQPVDPVLVRLFDLKGRMVVSKRIMPNEFSGATFNWNAGSSVNGLGRGLYTIKVSSGSLNKIFRITHTGK